MQSNVIKFRTIVNNHGNIFIFTIHEALMKIPSHLSCPGPKVPNHSLRLIICLPIKSADGADHYFLQTSSLRRINNGPYCASFIPVCKLNREFHVPDALGTHMIIMSNKHTPWCCIHKRGNIISDARSERLHWGCRPKLLILSRGLSWTRYVNQFTQIPMIEHHLNEQSMNR